MKKIVLILAVAIAAVSTGCGNSSKQQQQQQQQVKVNQTSKSVITLNDEVDNRATDVEITAALRQLDCQNAEVGITRGNYLVTVYCVRP